MKIASAGKGGSGKTTLSSLFARHLAEQGLPVVAVDADINQHLAEALGAAGNKVQTEQDVAFLRTQAGTDLVTWLPHEPAIRAMEQGHPFSLPDLGDGTRAALGLLQDTLDAQPRNWSRYARQAAEFHIKNARAWASAAAGEDLAAQVAPGFTLNHGQRS